MKNNRGVTMVALIITVIVMSIIIGVTVNISSKEIKEAKLQDLITNMLLIEAEVKIGVEEVVFQTANLTDETKIADIKEKNLIGDLVVNKNELSVLKTEDKNKTWYYLTNEDLESMGLYDIVSKDNEDSYYIYSYDEEELDIEIIYTGGYKHSDGKMFYKLSELENLQKS